ncbi:beta-ketoacyl [acyl carrier protein] synthase domain-containing protein [Couchioplanes caeruleus]|uniref:Ketosynthase n=2 Tax=Couchioplanes caeruleus TaxID=56438 RepID=A0A1K0GU92_9ACTN|nr:polyketide synthase [Couchioplanes caeruleus]OJF16062.1 Ketosynthase [Couchioplanes caeruleus subsp. caeruleus]ROP29946.1 ketoacyl-synthetase-like protein [Couchioplanes caeruleus]
MKDYIEFLNSLSREQLVLTAARQHAQENQGIAVVGMACRFPGGINDPGAFWAALCDERVVPAEPREAPPRWNPAAQDLSPFAGLLARGVHVEGVDLFEPERFGIDEEEARYLDPQQRLLLTCAQQALTDAGIGDTSGRRVGVYTGVSTVEFPFAHLRNGIGPDELSPYMGTGNALSATAARIATGLRLNGPVLTVDTACSSALTAVHLAVPALRRGECDIAVVGACHLQLAPFTSVVFDRAGMLSPTGRSRPFAKDADGHVRGEGCGVLVLKRLKDVTPDEPGPYAVIRGTALWQQGDRVAMTATPVAAQRRVMADALRAARVDPLDVRYVEAQANGSKLGGVIEAESTAAAYGREKPGAPPLYLGSCKANLGYLETASGAASLMKVALALSHGEIPAQPGFDLPDPDIAWDRLSIGVPRKRMPWPESARRVAGVSSFGFTGTNAHVLMEAATGAPPRSGSSSGPVAGRRLWPETHVWS